MVLMRLTQAFGSGTGSIRDQRTAPCNVEQHFHRQKFPNRHRQRFKLQKALGVEHLEGGEVASSFREVI